MEAGISDSLKIALLHLQGENGCLHSMCPQIVLYSLSRYLRETSRFVFLFPIPGLCMKISPSPSEAAAYIAGASDQLVTMAAYCDKHTPAEYLLGLSDGDVVSPSLHREISRQQRRVSRPILELRPEVVPLFSTGISGKNAESMEHLVPMRIFDKVMREVEVWKMVDKRAQVVTAICKYWALKREAGRGAPLIKRLQIEVLPSNPVTLLQPWSNSASKITQEQMDEMQKRLAVLLRLRNDLERVRLLADLVVKREKKKLMAATAQQNYFEILLTPLTRVFRDIVGKMKR